jgi:hypothetical protein
MVGIEVSCQVSCRKCGWNTGATILADDANVLDGVLRFIKECLPQHSRPGLSGELIVVWGPGKLESL